MTTPDFLDDPSLGALSVGDREFGPRVGAGGRPGAPPGEAGGSRWSGARGGPGRAPRRARPYRWRVLAWRLRFPVAAVLLGCAAALAVAELRPAPPPQVAVVVAARPLTPGTPLTDDDVRVVHLPLEHATAGTHASPDAVVGRALVVAVPAGLSIVDALLHDDRLVSAGPPGTVVVPVRLADPGVAALLRPGDRVDLFAATTSSTGAPVAERLAEHAVVLPRPPPVDDDVGAATGLLGTGPADDGAGSLTLVAVRPDQAQALAGASGWAGISAVLVG